jgi:capsular exopolysaccharide synthesis family protein
MGKIFNALEKYRRENKEYGDAVEPLQKQDLDALLQFNRRTGKLNITSRSVIKDPGTVGRLVAHQLIFQDGRITAAGENKCEELTFELRQSLAGSPNLYANEDQVAKSLIEDAFLNREAESKLVETNRDVQPQQPPPKVRPLGEENAVTRQVESQMNSAGAVSQVEPKVAELPTGGGRTERPAADSANRAASIPIGLAPPPRDGKPQGLRKGAIAAPQENFIEPERTVSGRHEETRLSAEAGDRRESISGDKKERPLPAVDPNLVSLLAPRSFEAEQFKILRTNLLYPISGKPPRSILVTSVSPEDGKSFVAANLAVSVALNVNRYVLLLDCDLRKPTIHRQFGFGDVPGLAEYLKDHKSLASLLLQTKVERLTILPGGSPPPNPSEILSSERMAGLLEEVTNRYKDRLIIIDSPPPTMTAETGVLARMSEGILLVARYSKTAREDLKLLIEHLGREKVVGCVLNQYDHRSVGFYGYRKYKKYGKTNYY